MSEWDKQWTMRGFAWQRRPSKATLKWKLMMQIFNEHHVFTENNNVEEWLRWSMISKERKRWSMKGALFKEDLQGEYCAVQECQNGTHEEIFLNRDNNPSSVNDSLSHRLHSEQRRIYNSLIRRCWNFQTNILNSFIELVKNYFQLNISTGNIYA